MINYINIDDNDLIENNPFGENLGGAEIDGWTDYSNPNKRFGYTDLVAFWSDAGRAAHITNADPTWYDASSIQEAVEKAQDQDYE